MTCKNCGTELENGAVFCTNCGTVVENENTVLAEETPVKDPGKVMGIVGMSLGIASCVFAALTFCCNPCYSFTCLALLLGLAGLALSIIAMLQSKKAGYKNTLALVGLISGVVGPILAVFFLFASVLISFVIPALTEEM